GCDVGVGLARVAGGAAGVVGVEAVAPLVVEHAGQLTCVAAAAAGLEEVDAVAAEERVAGLVEVDVGGQPAVEERVAGQPATRHIRDTVDLGVRGAGGRGVARRVAGRYAVVLAGHAAQVQDP